MQLFHVVGTASAGQLAIIVGQKPAEYIASWLLIRATCASNKIGVETLRVITTKV